VLVLLDLRFFATQHFQHPILLQHCRWSSCAVCYTDLLGANMMLVDGARRRLDLMCTKSSGPMLGNGIGIPTC
jgi:hypothetical protein